MEGDMRIEGRKLLGGVFALAVMGIVVDAHAQSKDFITVDGWVTTDANAMNASPATLMSSTCHNGSSPCIDPNGNPLDPDVLFKTSSIDFDNTVSLPPNTISQWLATSAASPSASYPNATVVTGDNDMNDTI
jgi:hypothetical protein